MPDRYAFIRKVIWAELELEQVVDVDKHCRVLKRAFPDLDANIIRTVVLQTVSQHGGAAVWGTDGPLEQFPQPRKG